MADLNIHTLVVAIRGLSNEITVRGLSSDLGISYSTLNRCNKGVWPRSVTLDAMRGVLESCRVRFYDGNDRAFVRSMLLLLGNQGVNTSALEYAYLEFGYEAFVEVLLTQASKRPGQDEQNEGQPPQPLGDPQAPVSVDPVMANKNDAHARELVYVLPIATVLVIGMLNFSLSDLITWASWNWMAFCAISTLIALLPALTGTLVDAPLAWRAYLRKHPNTSLTPSAFSHVAKYGSPTEMVPGAGRYDLTPAHLTFQPVCNLLGMMCYVALLALLLSLPGFQTFFADHEWAEFLKAGVAVAFFIAFGHVRDQRGKSFDVESSAMPLDNPDNYLPTRVHVWANTIHLVWTLSLLIVLLLSLIAYSLVEFRSMGTPLLMLWPYAQSMAYFAFCCTSPAAMRMRATAVGILVPGVVATSAGFSALVLVCYLPSWGGLALLVACRSCTIGALMWQRASVGSDSHSWMQEAQGSRAYSIAMAGAILVLLVVGLLTGRLG